MKVKVHSKLDSYLKDHGIIKKWLCEQIDCDKSQLTKWCKNNINGEAEGTPSVGYLLRLQKVLNCKTEDLFIEIEESE